MNQTAQTNPTGKTGKTGKTGVVQMSDITFGYPATDGGEPHLLFQNLTIDIAPGTCTLFCGPSGSGKSTALKMINGLIPQLQPGHMAGTVTVSGHDIDSVDLPNIGHLSATVFQNPRSQFFTTHVLSEIAYAGENYQVPADELWPRVQDAATQTATTDLLGRNLHTLSGGQLQAVAQASALAAEVPVLLYDEPTSNLSPEAIDKFTEVLRKQKAVGKTLIIAEHRLYFLRGLVDKVVYFQLDGPPQFFSGEEFFALSDEQRRSLGLRTLEPPRISDLVTGEFNTGGQSTALKAPSAPETENPLADGLSVCALDYAYPKHPVLADVNVDFPAGEITAITGANGAGKTTLARLLCGLAKPKAGQIYLDGQVQSTAKLTASTAIVMQDVHRQLFGQSVTEEVLLGSADQVDLETLLAELDLARFEQRHPLSLSGGQKQRLVIAAALATKRRVFIFDEPTSGVDYQQLCAISQLFRKLAEQGHVVVVITHDGELIKSCADNVWKLNPLSDSATFVSPMKDKK